jgi:hypothetical protein
MARETVHDLPPVNPPVGDDSKSDDFETESTAPVTSSSLTPAAAKMADGKIHEMLEFFKKTIVIDGERALIMTLVDCLVSTIPEVEIPTVRDSTVICFESHLIAGLGLPPNMFLVTIMSNHGCGLVHFNPNAIAALSCFTMPCECWLEIV